MDFIAQAEPAEKVSAEETAVRPVANNNPRRLNPKQAAKQQRLERNQGGIKPKRAPLTVWQEYAHALFQANEASFIH